MSTGEAKLTYEFQDIRDITPLVDRQISIDSTSLNSPGVSLPDDCSYFIEVIILSSNGTITESGARRYLKSYNKSGGTLSVGTAPEFLDNMTSRISASFSTNLNFIIINLEDSLYIGLENQNCKVFVNIKAYGV